MKPRAVSKSPGLLVSRRRFDDFIRRISQQLGFRVESDDFVSVRDTGHGLHIRRRKEKLIVLELELQHKWARGTLCVLAVDEDGIPYAGLTETTTYETGSVITTTTQPDPGPHWQTPGDEPHTCEAPDVDVVDTSEGEAVEDLEPEYFSPLSLSELLTGAAARVEDDGAPAVAQTRSWYPSVAAPTDISQTLGFWSDENAETSSRVVHRYLYRWRLVSGYRLRIEWDQGGSSQSLTLNPGETSSWYDDTVPATEEVTDLIDNVLLFVL